MNHKEWVRFEKVQHTPCLGTKKPSTHDWRKTEITITTREKSETLKCAQCGLEVKTGLPPLEPKARRYRRRTKEQISAAAKIATIPKWVDEQGLRPVVESAHAHVMEEALKDMDVTLAKKLQPEVDAIQGVIKIHTAALAKPMIVIKRGN
jgi:hypothetical protein